MADHIAALSALKAALNECDAYNAQFLAATPLPPHGPVPDGPPADVIELQRLGAVVRERGEAYDRAWNEAGRPDPHYPWKKRAGEI